MSENEVAVSTTAPLSITLFGPLSIQIQSEPFPKLRSRKAQWLLALLVLRHGRPVDREWLAGTLWPEVEQTQAFANMRPTLSDLRKALGSESARLQSPNRHSLFLDLAGAEVDFIRFDKAFASETSVGLQHAITLYRGPLLEGCTEEWVFAEREKREQDCLRALQTLGDTARGAGEYKTAVGYYRRAMALDPWRDTARRGLMEALAQSGDRSAALHVYREYIAQLRETPQMAPDEETRTLYNRLRAEASQQSASPAVVVSALPVPVVTGYIPYALTDLIGREEECIEVANCLRRSRLVTLTGVGGIGKTRLAMAIAEEVVREYADGVWLVPLEALESLSEDQQVFAQIASVLGVKEAAGQRLSECVTEHLRQKRLLLVLDNCEHLLTVSAEAVNQLLSECANVRILATSREALGITGETAWMVPSLPAPDPARLPEGRATLLRVLIGYESVQLFVERAQAVQKTFALTGSNAATIAQICYQLEGIPLAIELAAARVKALTVEQIAARLEDHLSLLTEGSRTAQARQQTLRATLEWSYVLLSESERRLLQRLSVFAGGWTLEAAEAVCSDSAGLQQNDILPLLTALVDKSLVSFVEEKATAGGRFRMLEMVRQFAGERLAASGEQPLLMARHQDWFVILAEEAEPQFSGATQAEWLRRIATEYDNLRAVFARSEQGACSAEEALRLAGALWFFWYIRSDYSEGRKYLAKALEHKGLQARTSAYAQALVGLGILERSQMEYMVALGRFEESLSIYRERGDRKGIASALSNLGSIQIDLGNYVAARALYEENLSIRRQLNDRSGVARTLANLGSQAQAQGDLPRARGLLEESLLIHRELGDQRGTAWDLLVLGSVLSEQGDLIQAETLYEECRFHFQELGDRAHVAWAYNYQGRIADRQRDYTRAQTLFQESLSVFRDMGDKYAIASSLQDLGSVTFKQGELASAQSLLEEALSIFQERQHKHGIATTLVKLGRVAYTRGNDTKGAALFKEGLSLFKEMGEKQSTTLNGLASMVQGRDVNFAVSLWGAAQSLRESAGEVMPPQDQETYDRDLSQAHVTMGDDAFVAAWEAGHAMTWEQAADYALEKLEAQGSKQ